MYCQLCSRPSGSKFCCEECRAKYYRTVIVQQNSCAVCKKKFDVTTNQQARKVCFKKECRSAHCKASHSRGVAGKPVGTPQHIRATYCVKTIEGQQVRCKIHMETCGAGCYRTDNGRPICRVEQETIPLNYYSSSLAGMSALRV